MSDNKNNYNSLSNNINTLALDALIQQNEYVIFMNHTDLSNTYILNLKNDLSKKGIVSVNTTRDVLSVIFKREFSFFNSHIFCAFINDKATFIAVERKIRHDKQYMFFCYKKVFINYWQGPMLFRKPDAEPSDSDSNSGKGGSSALFIESDLDLVMKNYDVYLHYMIFKVINNIVLIILYHIYSLVKLINFRFNIFYEYITKK